MLTLVNQTSDPDVNKEQFEKNMGELKETSEVEQLLKISARIVKENFEDVLEQGAEVERQLISQSEI